MEEEGYMQSCKRCGSMAINPKLHGRTDSDMNDLCDVCYWRTAAENLGDLMKSMTQLVVAENEEQGSFMQEVENLIETIKG